MIKKLIIISFTFLLALNFTSCKKPEKYEKYQAEFIGLFNTYAIIVGYAKSQDEFDKYANIIYDRLEELDKKYTIYEDYNNVVNIKTINDMAGIEPVKVDKDILDLLVLSKNGYEMTDGTANIAMGAVLSIWHDYRTAGKLNEETAELPPFSDLLDASEHIDINNLIIDEENSTVYLADPRMSLDVGGTAKGYAASLAVQAAVDAGMVSALANIGGNIISVGKPLDGVRERWGVGIQDPNLDINGTSNIIDTIYVNNISVVCSGSYERYYVVDGETYNHIIDPETLMPAIRYKSVTILLEDTTISDLLSTALFIMDIETGTELAKRYNAEVLWIYHDDTMDATDGYKAISKKYSNYSAIDG